MWQIIYVSVGIFTSKLVLRLVFRPVPPPSPGPHFYTVMVTATVVASGGRSGPGRSEGAGGARCEGKAEAAHQSCG